MFKIYAGHFETAKAEETDAQCSINHRWNVRKMEGIKEIKGNYQS